MPPQIDNQTPSSPITPTPNPHRHTRLFLLTTALILVGILGVGYYFVWQSDTIGCKRSSLDIIEENNYTLADNGNCQTGYHTNRLRCVESLVWCEPDQVATADQFTDWKTYRNEEYGFEFKTPQEWKTVQFVGHDDYTIFGLSLGIFNGDYPAWINIVSTNNVEEAIEKHVSNYVEGTKIEKRGKITIDNVEGEEILINVGGNNEHLSRWILIPHDKKIYILGVTSSILQEQSEFNQLLSTFKFISTSTPTQ